MALFTQARGLAAALAITLLIGSAPRAAQPAKLAHLGGMDQLKAWFNAAGGRPRLILLLSPT